MDDNIIHLDMTSHPQITVTAKRSGDSPAPLQLGAPEPMAAEALPAGWRPIPYHACPQGSINTKKLAKNCSIQTIFTPEELNSWTHACGHFYIFYHAGATNLSPCYLWYKVLTSPHGHSGSRPTWTLASQGKGEGTSRSPLWIVHGAWNNQISGILIIPKIKKQPRLKIWYRVGRKWWIVKIAQLCKRGNICFLMLTSLSRVIREKPTFLTTECHFINLFHNK